jgi:alkyl hydroperoxide reductase subunit AhpC
MKKIIISDSPQIGKMAPNFLTIGVYKNQLLIFYPANFTFVSATELIGLNDRISEF